MKSIFNETNYDFDNAEERAKAIAQLKKELAESGTIEDLAFILEQVTKRFGVLIRQQEK